MTIAAATVPVAGRLTLAGAPLDPLGLADCVEFVERAIAERRGALHNSLNAAKLVRIQEDAELREALWASDLVTADGQPVVWAARALGHRLPERVAGIDLMEALLVRAAERGHRVYLLGARPDVVAEAAAELLRRHPTLQLAGVHDGYFPSGDDEAVAAEVAGADADLLFVALETPRKERFLAAQRDNLGVGFAMGVGGALDVLAARRRRAPRWAQRAGLEWLFRLLQEPRRLMKRYAVGNTRFLALVIKEAVRR